LQLSSDINKDEKIYLYCRSGNRSGKATKILEDAGYINVINAGSIQEASKLLGINIID
jgi:phage shock protein E